jgi:hypothetical protein
MTAKRRVPEIRDVPSARPAAYRIKGRRSCRRQLPAFRTGGGATRAGILAIALLLPAAWPAAAQTASPPRTKESVTRDLDEVARVASVMVDGDLCRRIMSPRAVDRIFNPDPKDPWSASDDFNVNHEPYIQAKKTLMRLARIVDYPCDVNLWMPFDGHPDKIQVLIRNVYEMSQFWTWGELTQDMFPEMRKVLDSGTRQTVMRRAGMLSVLAPVFDSLGDVVGVLEVVAQDPAAPPIPVHARAGNQR